MNYHQFRNALKDFSVFSTRDVIKQFPQFDTRRLTEWQQKKYIKKLINKWYIFSDISLDDHLRYRISNCLYRPSYVSLESALAHYNLIPEGVYAIQNITTRKTILYETGEGNFQYRNIKRALYFGYRAERINNLPILIASPEKAILDSLYLNARIKSAEDIEALRFNSIELNKVIDWQKLEKYNNCFKSLTLKKRITWLKKTTMHAHTF